jgi:D-lactate dehydrogenase
MKVRVYSSYNFIIPYLEKANQGKHELFFEKEALTLETAEKANGFDAISIFSSDDASQNVLVKLAELGIRYIALRSTGFDCVALEAAKKLNLHVANVPEYSPNAIAEHALALLLALNRKLIISNDRVRNNNFSIEGLTGFDLYGKTIGIVGTGKIGKTMARICKGIGCKLLAYDLVEDKALMKETGIVYTGLARLCELSDVITLHVPLNDKIYHLINKNMVARMKQGVILINTARGAVVDTASLLAGITSGKIGALGMDVYEFEKACFFKDYSQKQLEDKLLQTLISLPNVLITSHHAFLTQEALTNIAKDTIEAFDYWEKGKIAPNELYHMPKEEIKNPIKQTP